MIVLFEGPDGCGKTEISQALARRLGVPYFKVDSEKTNWKKDSFHKSLWFDHVLPQFIQATGVSCVFDRSYVSEWAYSHVFGRNTDWEMLGKTDESFARLGAIVVVLLRRDYSNNRADELVPNEKLTDLHVVYKQLPTWTKCRTVTMYVDDFQNDLGQQLDPLGSAIRWMTSQNMTDAINHIVLERRK